MDDLWSPAGICIRLDSGAIYDVASPDLPADALDAWLDRLNVVQLRKALHMLIDRSHAEMDRANAFLGFDAGYPPDG